MRLQIDRKAGSAYLYLYEVDEGIVSRTEQVTSAVLADYDKWGNTIGLELLSYPLVSSQEGHMITWRQLPHRLQ